jgi:hypothetical protein
VTVASVSKLSRASTSVDTRPGMMDRISVPNRTSKRSIASSSGRLPNRPIVSFSRGA